MRILIVASGNKGHLAPFVVEQAEALKKAGCTVDFYSVEGKGATGYLAARGGLLRAIKTFKPDIIHAHYGLCGLLAGLQRKVPVVTTFHGSDINDAGVRPFSRIAMRLSAHSIFVWDGLAELIKPSGSWSLIPCGIDISEIPEMKKSEAREKLGISPSQVRVLFAGAFDNPVKNSPLAFRAMELFPEAQIVELKDYSRREVALQMLAADALLMTSLTEGSPQVIKEAMAAGCPVVSVDVGDVRKMTEGIDGCWICERTAEDIASKLHLAAAFNARTEGRKRLEERGLDNALIAAKLIEIYQSLA